jgi:hypothetical protein
LGTPFFFFIHWLLFFNSKEGQLLCRPFFTETRMIASQGMPVRLHFLPEQP